MKKSCGGCQYFRKWKKDRIGGGLCEKFDWRTKSDYGGNCKGWKAIPYKRLKHGIIKIDSQEN